MGEFLSNLYTFKGRLGRLGFIWKYIVIMVSIIAFSLLGGFVSGLMASSSPIASLVISIITGLFVLSLSFIPPFAITARRLHDIGVSGWWQILPMVLGAASFSYIIFNTFGSVNILEMGAEETLARLASDNVSAYKSLAMGTTAIYVIFGLMLLFYPGTKGPNKYNDSGFSLSGVGQNKRNYGSSSTNQKFLVNFTQEIPEDSMYLFKNLKEQTPGVIKITAPQDRRSASIEVSAVSGLDQKKVKKLFSSLGFPVKNIFKES